MIEDAEQYRRRAADIGGLAIVPLAIDWNTIPGELPNEAWIGRTKIISIAAAAMSATNAAAR
jgi:hypothetical protein